MTKRIAEICSVDKAEYSNRLFRLRERMKNYTLDAYIVPNEGDHQEEYPGPSDLRRQYLSGFSGSAGDAVVTMDKALLWTDTRYYLQAGQQLGPEWNLMKQKDDTIAVWLRKNLKKGQKVGVDGKKITHLRWKNLEEQLVPHKIKLLDIENNIVDEIWEDKPISLSNNSVFIHEYNFSGEYYHDKVLRVKEKLKELNADAIVVSALDEIAWLLNLRGDDIKMTPVFKSYVIISQNWTRLYIDENKLKIEVIDHLSHKSAPVEILPYETVWDDILELVNESNKILIPNLSSQAVFQKVPKDLRITGDSPIMNMKATKNDIEVQGSRNAHLRDAVALCELFRLLEQEVPNNVYWDELKVVKKLKELRAAQKYNKGESFSTIAAFGKNGALVHYTVTPETNLRITTDGLLTIDSGGQYLDGTIDTTRVLHFGTPSEKVKTIYTSLLQGVADMATTVFPDGTPDSALAFIIRRPLAQLGLTFGHGTTHGTGIFLGVHEAYNGSYHYHFIGSQEPGYYKEEEFGMRLENLIVVEEADVQNEDNLKTLMKFSPLTLVPYELKLIDVARMDKSQINWLNEYHEHVRTHVGAEMVKQGKIDLQEWLINKTMPIS